MDRSRIATARGPSGMATGLVGTVVIVAALSVVADGLRSSSPHFYDDDPVAREVDTKDAAGVQPKNVNLWHDQARNLFATPGDREDRRALNVNTIDEVPDSSWFANRILARGAPSMTAEGVARGPDAGRGPAPGPWTIVSGKREGITPGLTVVDTSNARWFIKFDPPKYPEMATGAEVVVTKLFHALGYYVPENTIVLVRREDLVVSEESTTVGMNGATRRMRDADVDAVLRVAARRRDGSYRVIASKALPGEPVGPFLFAGTRPDNPNDVVPHEHRRELRGLRVFAAWVNHVDSKANNTLDTLVRDGERVVVRHHLIDFGSTLGSASIKPREFDEGHMYIVEPGSLLSNALSFGFHVRPFERLRYRGLPSVGRFSAARFDPDRWKPRVPNAAFLRARADDLFWGARRVMAFTDEMIRAAVETGQYSDPEAAQHITETLIARRDLIGRSWLMGVNPVVDPWFDGKVLSFRNAAVDAGVASPPAAYHATWFAFDNVTGETTHLGETAAANERVERPEAVANTTALFLRVDVAAEGDHVSWIEPVRIFFRRNGNGDGWRLVGLERLPDVSADVGQRASGSR